MNREKYEKEVTKCIRTFWRSRSSALAKNKKGKRQDTGSRGGATAGKNLDGFSRFLQSEIKLLGEKNLEVYERKKLVTLPGYFRPTKQWDLVVTHLGNLVAVIELKTLGGPSFGNNANNRCEEAIGSAVDFRTLQREGGFGGGAAPFLGYFILIHDEEGSRREPSKPPSSPHFSCDPIFQTASYQKRMSILCERMMQEGLYDCAAAMASPKATKNSANFQDLSETASFHRLLVKLTAHIQSECSLFRF